MIHKFSYLKFVDILKMTSATPEFVEQDGVEASRSSDEHDNTMAYQPTTINLDSSIFEGP